MLYSHPIFERQFIYNMYNFMEFIGFHNEQ